MLDKLKRWYDLLGREGINSKNIVRKEINDLIKTYESSNETKIKFRQKMPTLVK